MVSAEKKADPRGESWVEDLVELGREAGGVELELPTRSRPRPVELPEVDA